MTEEVKANQSWFQTIWVAQNQLLSQFWKGKAGTNVSSCTLHSTETDFGFSDNTSY